MLPTPSTTHIDPSLIYPPAEDSYLLLDTLSSASEIQFLHSRFHPTSPHPHPHPTSLPPPPPPDPPSPTHNPAKPSTSPLVVELGTGSGIILAFLTAHAPTLFGRPDILTLGLDINPEACIATVKTVERACADVRSQITRNEDGDGDEDAGVEGGEGGEEGYFIGSVNGDLCGSLKEGEVDMLVFNPPYVPTPSVPSIPNPADSAPGSKPKHQAASTAVAPAGEEEPEDLLAFSYAGGVHGMEVTNRLLAQLPLVLRRGKGVAYVVLCRQNRPEEVVERVRGWGGDGDGGWRCEVVGRSGRFGGWEKLVVVRIWRGERF